MNSQRAQSIEHSRSPSKRDVDEPSNDYIGRERAKMSRTFVHGYYMPKEFRKSLVKDEKMTHWKLGHD